MIFSVSPGLSGVPGQLATGARHGNGRVLVDLCGAHVILQSFGDYLG
jgi:hypothetical protein